MAWLAIRRRGKACCMHDNESRIRGLFLWCWLWSNRIRAGNENLPRSIPRFSQNRRSAQPNGWRRCIGDLSRNGNFDIERGDRIRRWQIWFGIKLYPFSLSHSPKGSEASSFSSFSVLVSPTLKHTIRILAEEQIKACCSGQTNLKRVLENYSIVKKWVTPNQSDARNVENLWVT